MPWLVLIPIVIGVLLAISITGNISMPDWAKAPCHACGNVMKWLKGQDSNSTGEAKFLCKSCGCSEYRGGMASELAMENWESKK
jgi:hypothetical protein